MVLLHEHIGWRTFAGGAVIVLGVLLIVTANRMPAGEPASAEPPAELARDEDVTADEGAA